jgi:hypothetical protein
LYSVARLWGADGEAARVEDEKATHPELRIADVVTLGFAALTVMIASDLIKSRLFGDLMPRLCPSGLNFGSDIRPVGISSTRR